MADRPALSLRPGGGNRGGGGVVVFGGAPVLRPHVAALPVAKDTLLEDRKRVKYTRDQLMLLSKALVASEDILKIKRDIDAELFGEEKKQWGRAESNLTMAPQGRQIEPDSGDWRGRSSNIPSPVEERSWDAGRENRGSGNRYDSRRMDGNQIGRQDSFNYQFSRSQISPNQGGGPAHALVKADAPWSARKGHLSEQERVLKTIKGSRILNKLTPDNFERLKDKIVESGITTADILKGVISLIFDKAVLEPTFCFMYARLCSVLNEKLPNFPSDEPGSKPVTFKRLLLSNCQEAFEGADKLRQEVKLMTGPEQEAERQDKEKNAKTLNSWKHQADWRTFEAKNGSREASPSHRDGPDNKVCPAEENVEVMSQFFITIGKQLDAAPKSKWTNDMYFGRLNELTTNRGLAPRLRFMVRDVIDLRANNWIPRRKEVKAKTISEIHSEAELDLKLRPGATAGMRNRPGPPQASTGPGGFPILRPGTGGMMPGMSGEWEVQRSRSIPRGYAAGRKQPLLGKSTTVNSKTVSSSRPSPIIESNAAPACRPLTSVTDSVSGNATPTTLLSPSISLSPADLARKTKALLEEYFNIKILDEALFCIEELKSPAYHPEVVKIVISSALDKGPSYIKPLSNLLHHLHTKNVFTSSDIGTGCLLFASALDDIAIDLRKAPSGFGEVLSKSIISSEVDFKLVNEVLQKVEDDFFQKAILNSAIQTVGSSPSGQAVLTSQAADITACQSLLQ